MIGFLFADGGLAYKITSSAAPLHTLVTTSSCQNKKDKNGEKKMNYYVEYFQASRASNEPKEEKKNGVLSLVLRDTANKR